MRYFNLSAQEYLSMETLDSFSEWLGELEASDDYGRINLASPGGNVEIAMCMIDMINQSNKIKEVYVYAECCSAGLFFITDCWCEVHICDGAYSIFHAPARTLNLRELNNKSSMIHALNKFDEKRDYDEKTRYESIGLTKQEIDTIYDMKDIFLDSSRLNEIRQCCLKNIPESVKENW